MSSLIIKVGDLPEELPAIQAIRRVVFQEGQGVESTLDFDGKDVTCTQLIAYLDEQPVGTARIRYLDGETAKIERLAVLSKVRGLGIGKQIMEKALLIIASQNIPEVVIHAQEHIVGLYQQLGFKEESEVFEEAGIRHVKMRKILNASRTR
ncbi:MAG: GNAT family N-acetyltransferase [Cyanomargarita calcarea GSE-NOS-MK-12-04C]|jgi:predicted GNAT family N-acyltransferase|uniref:GNAT family N-acetyltransferase n=1 Tax=Cyanomargarita calcarea GSE-NOS-MK-12-04C TaxID=2839659 RepID=A0A951QGA6_9CYAN|nr:GNAT family N-acetyltransferase [Cyanomargarita calcarea GSE-NOS-MK-12-04C]